VSLFSLNEPRFEPREIYSHTKLARQPPYYNIMDPTPLGRYCSVGEILKRFSYVLIALLQASILSRVHCSKRCIQSGLYRVVPSLTASANILNFLPSFTAAPPRTHAVGLLEKRAWAFRNNFFLGPPHLHNVVGRQPKIKSHLVFGPRLRV
jgi:hypothetical protein